MSNEAGTVIRKFNPGLLQSDEEIREQFVVRGHELDLVLDELRGNIDSPSCQHILVFGPRGRGKTMLLARIAAELRSNPDFADALLPVRFMEESPEIFTLTDFWLETMFHLANEVDGRNAPLAQELHEIRAALAPRWREQITEAQARAAVFDAVDRLGKRLVLIVENLQSLCRDARDEFGWQLREVLQTEPQIILLASATSRFRELDEVDEPFFEMFRIVSLEALDTEECGRLWKVVSGKRATPLEVRPLQILTGGNPRLLVMAAEFARHRSIRRLMSELVTLIDEHTEYFRGHLEVLPKTERRVYVSVIDLWQPSSASEVAARARVDIRVASTMLGRLVERGAVVRQGRGRKRLYAAAEPLYSMYYKLRRERDETAVVENLIRFMVACYGVDDLWQPSDPLSVEAAESEVLRRGIRRHTAVALSYKCMAQAEIGLADEALDSCRQLEDVARLWTNDSEEFLGVPWVAWLKCRIAGARALALAVRAEHRASIRQFRIAYAASPSDHEATIHEMLRLVPALVGAGISPRDLLAVFAGDAGRSADLWPLVVALEEHAGNQIRAPRQVKEVAADIRDRFIEAAERMGAT
ncbi:MAG: AAA family ATPase [Gammaproteobacteria bacterium]|nr:AAA family ATPase [Gammaproteobacteria bacterium]MYL07131.1 AAA family ATPase [Gemmatimonadales bacterium]